MQSNGSYGQWILVEPNPDECQPLEINKFCIESHQLMGYAPKSLERFTSQATEFQVPKTQQEKHIFENPQTNLDVSAKKQMT